MYLLASSTVDESLRSLNTEKERDSINVSDLQKCNCFPVGSSEPGGERRKETKEEEGRAAGPCINVSPNTLKLNFNGLLLVTVLPYVCMRVCVEYLCMYPAPLTFPSSG